MANIDKNNLGYLGADYQLRLVAQILTDRKFGELIDILNLITFKMNMLE
jgi:hypothetical protein